MMPELYDYQQEDVTKLMYVPGVALFDEQRTGKTPKALRLAKAKQATKILIVCPNTMLYVWKQEYIKWIGEPCEVFGGTKAQRQALLDNWEYGLVIGYDMLKLVHRGDQVHGALPEILKGKPDCVIADEAHRFRTHDTSISKAMHKVAYVCKHRIALTGTPVVNKQNDLFGILRFLYPVTFKSYWKFIGNYFETVKSFGSHGSYNEILGLNALGKQEIPKLLENIGTNRKRKEVMAWLPEKDRIDVRLPMTKLQKKYITELAQYYETGNVIVQGTLDRLIRYRQICLAPGLLDLEGSAPKVEWLKMYFKEYDRPTILFTKFTSFIIKYAHAFLPENAAVITGHTTAVERKARVDAFQRGKINTLLMNIDTCNEGVTLDRAECCIFIDKFPPAGTIQQAEDRFIATTAARKDKGHLIYSLIMEDSYEERISEMIDQGISAAEVINNFKEYLYGNCKQV